MATDTELISIIEDYGYRAKRGEISGRYAILQLMGHGNLSRVEAENALKRWENLRRDYESVRSTSSVRDLLH